MQLHLDAAGLSRGLYDLGDGRLPDRPHPQRRCLLRALPAGDLYWTWFTKECAYRLSKAALRCMPILLIAAFLPAPYGLRIPGLPQLGLFLLSGFLALLNIAALGL